MSIINDALKKAQSNLNNKDAVPPPQKTLATIEQEQKEKELELKRQQESMAQRRPSSLRKLLKISFFIFLFVSSILTFLYLLSYLKEIPFSKKFPQISILAKSFNQKIASLLHEFSSSKSDSLNPVAPAGMTSSAASSQKKISPKNLVLKGIITKNNHQAALINDEIYEEGSMIGEMKVISISFQEVKLLEGDQTITLRIKGERR